jgi:hypothetical protein
MPPFRYGMLPSSFSKSGARFLAAFAETFVKQAEQENNGRTSRTCPCPVPPGSGRDDCAGNRVAVEEALALDEIDEHQPVEHHGGIPDVRQSESRLLLFQRHGKKLQLL